MYVLKICVFRYYFSEKTSCVYLCLKITGCVMFSEFNLIVHAILGCLLLGLNFFFSNPVTIDSSCSSNFTLLSIGFESYLFLTSYNFSVIYKGEESAHGWHFLPPPFLNMVSSLIFSFLLILVCFPWPKIYQKQPLYLHTTHLEKKTCAGMQENWSDEILSNIFGY